MAQKTIKIRRNADDTMTVGFEGYLESISLREKESWQILDEVKWAIITAGFDFSLQMEELVRKELDLG